MLRPGGFQATRHEKVNASESTASTVPQRRPDRPWEEPRILALDPSPPAGQGSQGQDGGGRYNGGIVLHPDGVKASMTLQPPSAAHQPSANRRPLSLTVSRLTGTPNGRLPHKRSGTETERSQFLQYRRRQLEAPTAQTLVDRRGAEAVCRARRHVPISAGGLTERRTSHPKAQHGGTLDIGFMPPSGPAAVMAKGGGRRRRLRERLMTHRDGPVARAPFKGGRGGGVWGGGGGALRWC